MTSGTVAAPHHRVASLRGGARRHHLTIGVILGLAFAFYVWTAATSYSIAFSRTVGESTPYAYNLLATALLHGHLYLPIKVPAGLAHLAHPYNPVDNAPWQQGAFHDLILYHDHLYSAWGPSATLLFLVFRIFGLNLPISLANALYCCGALIASVALLHALARRFVARMPDWALSVATAGLASMDIAPFLLRRPDVYEAAISACLCFEMLGLYLVATASLGPTLRRGRLAWGSLWLGLALLARPTMAIDLVIMLGVVGLLLRRGESRRATVLAALAPFTVCLIALFAYNAARFGGVSNFGTRYQLSGFDSATHPIEQLDYVPPGVFSYLFIPGQVSLVFPHFFLQTTAQLPFAVPSSYEGVNPAVNGSPEVAGGLLPTMPITILLLWCPVAWIRRRPSDRGALLVIAAGIAATLAVMVLLAYALPGTTQRYEMDYASFALIVAFLLWGLLLGRRRPGRWGRRAVATGGVLLTILGGAAGVAVSFTGYQDLLQLEHPRSYADLQDLTAPVVTGITALIGHPVIVAVAGPAPVSAAQGSPYLQFQDAGATTYVGGSPVTITVVAPHRQTAALTMLAFNGNAVIDGQVVQARADHQLSNAPVRYPSLRIPIRLHGGVNHVTLTVAGATPAELSQLGISDIRVEN